MNKHYRALWHYTAQINLKLITKKNHIKSISNEKGYVVHINIIQV